MAQPLRPSGIRHRCMADQQTRVVLGLGWPDNGKLAQADEDGR
ncbi:hypothetical protein ACFW9N_23845 [Streptomyces sp. NPDC059496]